MKRHRSLLLASLGLAVAGSAVGQELRYGRELSPTPALPPQAVESFHAGITGQTTSVGVNPNGATSVEPCGRLAARYPRVLKWKCCMQATHWGYPEEFATRPFGTFHRAAMNAQIDSGLAAQLALYRFDFAAPNGIPSASLNAEGQRRLLRLSHLLFTAPCPLVIEYDPLHPEIGESRRQAVLAQLQAMNPQLPSDHVVVGKPAAFGRSGDEAIILQQKLLKQVETGGLLQGGGSSTATTIIGSSSSQSSSNGTTTGQ